MALLLVKLTKNRVFFEWKRAKSRVDFVNGNLKPLEHIYEKSPQELLDWTLTRALQQIDPTKKPKKNSQTIA